MVCCFQLPARPRSLPDILRLLLRPIRRLDRFRQLRLKIWLPRRPIGSQSPLTHSAAAWDSPAIPATNAGSSARADWSAEPPPWSASPTRPVRRALLRLRTDSPPAPATMKGADFRGRQNSSALPRSSSDLWPPPSWHVRPSPRGSAALAPQTSCCAPPGGPESQSFRPARPTAIRARPSASGLRELPSCGSDRAFGACSSPGTGRFFFPRALFGSEGLAVLFRHSFQGLFRRQRILLYRRFELGNRNLQFACIAVRIAPLVFVAQSAIVPERALFFTREALPDLFAVLAVIGQNCTYIMQLVRRGNQPRVGVGVLDRKST